MEELTKDEKKQALINFERKQEKRYHIGKIIVFTFATYNIISAIISVFIDFNFFTLIIQIALSGALYWGVTWARYFFAIGSSLGAFALLYALCTSYSYLPVLLIIFVVINFAFCIISSILLFKSKCVSEFLYSQEN